MNKDVIYIEPEDDITDVISRIKASKQKVVALVPPKKLGIMRSAVNIKLITKTAKIKDKAAVVVTTDPSLIKLAAFSGLPVAKTLNSRPMLPSEFTERKKREAEELEEDNLDLPAEDDSKKTEIIDERATQKTSAKKSEVVELDDDEASADETTGKPKKSPKTTSKIPNFDRYRKWILLGSAATALLGVVLVWALVFAPAAKITIKMKTIASNISENVTLVTDIKNKDNKAGKFLLEQIKYEESASVEFEPKGKANRGEKAQGTVNFSATFLAVGGSKVVPVGTIFTLDGKNFVTTTAKSLSWDGAASTCRNPAISGGQIICNVRESVEVVATEGGTNYNIAAQSTGTSNLAGINFVSSSAMAGGTDKNITVVSEADINDAKSQLQNLEGAKEKLLSQIGDGVVKIDASYKVTTEDPVSSPKKGEEVEAGKKAKLTAKAIYTIYVVDRTAIDEYVNAFEADKIGDHDKIYTTGNPFFERFAENKDNTFTAKFKTTIKIGPEISESSILETAKGKKVGELKALLKDTSSNINDVIIDVSFPWVYSIPTDANKVSVKIEVEE